MVPAIFSRIASQAPILRPALFGFNFVMTTSHRLAYVGHRRREGMVLHRDLKPANIFLDRNRKPRTGPARLAPCHQTLS